MSLARRAAFALPLVVSLAASGAAFAHPGRGHDGDSDHGRDRGPKAASGVATLRTTDDAGTCAADPRATSSPTGAACPTFKLDWATPAAKPRGLVVVFHGHGHNGEQYTAQLRDFADKQGVVAVAMETTELAVGKPSYRGPFESVDEEARDAAVAIGWARERFHTKQTYLFGVSMGGSGLAYFLDAATRSAAGDKDATWVQSFHTLPLAGLVDVEGIANLAETWAEASGFDKVSQAEIEAETGGTPQTARAAYQSRSLALLPASAWQKSGLPVVSIVHDVDDGLVPYNQTHEARAAVAAAGITLQTYDVVFKSDCAQGDQTNGSAVITGQIPGFPTSTTEGELCLAGHANENNPNTPVMRAAAEALAQLTAGNTKSSTIVWNPTHP